jgi:hypothetical protein
MSSRLLKQQLRASEVHVATSEISSGVKRKRKTSLLNKKKMLPAVITPEQLAQHKEATAAQRATQNLGLLASTAKSRKVDAKVSRVLERITKMKKSNK